MAYLPPYSDSNGDTGVGPTADRPLATPRWVKVFVITFIALVLLFVILHLTGLSFGGHTP